MPFPVARFHASGVHLVQAPLLRPHGSCRGAATLGADTASTPSSARPVAVLSILLATFGSRGRIQSVHTTYAPAEPVAPLTNVPGVKSGTVVQGR